MKASIANRHFVGKRIEKHTGTKSGKGDESSELHCGELYGSRHEC